VGVIKSSRIGWAGHVARIGERGEAYTGFRRGNLRERGHWGDPGIDRIMLKWTFRKWDVWVWTGLRWPRMEIGGGHL
jgi:hypothetical protein